MGLSPLNFSEWKFQQITHQHGPASDLDKGRVLDIHVGAGIVGKGYKGTTSLKYDTPYILQTYV